MGLKSLKSKRKARVIDRISELPDAVLCHILSFLETKCAVKTNILSTRWKNVWASIPNLDICYWHFRSSGAFCNFVERVLSFHDSSDIQKFLLECRFDDIISFSHVDRWIHTAIKHNVVDLDLSVDAYKGQKFELPERLFTCKTLMALKLRSEFIIKVPASGCFPSLKFLSVILDFPDENDSILQLFRNCPVLEDLTIDGYGAYDEILNINISAPELKRLKVNLGSNNSENGGYNFSVLAPKLENLDIVEQGFSNYFLENAKSLIKVNIRLWDHTANEFTPLLADWATTLLAGICNVKHLSISVHLLEASSLPYFDDLNRLELVLHQCNDWEVLMELLNRSPNLEYLVLEHNQGDDCDSEIDEYPKHVWDSPEFVPICLLSRLKTISISGFKGRKDEMEAAKYLLKNGEVLDTMTIYTDEIRPKKEKQLYKEFRKFQRGSKTCQVKLSKIQF